jgi:N-methylhydantoinase A
MTAEGNAFDDIAVTCALDLRYTGQAYELTVPIEWRAGQPLDIAPIAAAFHAEHERTYGHASADEVIELVNLRAVGSLRSQKDRAYDAQRAGGSRASSSGARVPVLRRAYFGKTHGFIDTPVISRADLRAVPMSGPLIVEEYDSTCVVPPNAGARVDAHENIVITFLEQSA